MQLELPRPKASPRATGAQGAEVVDGNQYTIRPQTTLVRDPWGCLGRCSVCLSKLPSVQANSPPLHLLRGQAVRYRVHSTCSVVLQTHNSQLLGECLPGAHARHAIFVLSILSLAPSSHWEVPPSRTALDHKPSLQGTLHKPKYENSTTQNVTPLLPTTTLGIIINWVQRMGQILRHSERILSIVW